MQLAAPDDQRCAAPGAGCCPACGSGRSERAFDVAGYELRRCRRCASLWATGAPGPDDLAGLYADASYYRNAEYSTGDFRGYRDYLADRASIEAKFEAVLARIERHVPPGTLLDVGSGPGLLVAAAQRRGWEARGLDLNPWAVAEAGSVAGAEVELGTLDDADLEAGSLDALTAMDLIEHLPGPGEWLDAAARAVRPGGGLALLTPDAGSPTTQVLGSRWPEVRRVPEHLVLYSVRGLAALLKRHGFESLCWHSVGKRTSLATLASDLRPLAPALTGPLARAAHRLPGSGVEIDFDPRAKFCLYALRARGRRPSPTAPPRPVRTSTRPGTDVAEAIREDLEHLASARRLADWTFAELIGDPAQEPLGAVAEVGAGIGNFSGRLRRAGADPLVLIEPERACADELERRFEGDRAVTVARQEVPGASALVDGAFDLVVCQNVLEHIDDDLGAVASMAAALRPGGRLALLVPAEPRYFGSLDLTYGHRRRYEREALRRAVAEAGLTVERLEHFNLLGVLGWRAASLVPRARVGRASMAAYEALLRAWRPLERRLRPRRGLSLLCVARAPEVEV